MQQDKATYRYEPKEVYYMITIECNQKCSKCSHWKNKDKGKRLLPEKIIKMLFGIPSVKEFIIVGGEPLIFKKEIRDILKGISKTKIRTTIITNGVSMDKEFIDFVKDFNTHIVVSIDTLDKEYWKFVRGSNSFDRVMKNFEYATKILNPEKLSIQSVLAKETEKHIENVAKYAEKIELYHSQQLYVQDGFEGNWTSIKSENTKNQLYENLKCIAAGKNLSIMQNGDVFTCFQQSWIKDCETALGNLNVNEIETVLTSKYTKRVYEKMISCNLPCKVLKCNIE